MLSIFRRLMKNTQGATAVEYTLITSLIAVAAIALFVPMILRARGKGQVLAQVAGSED